MQEWVTRLRDLTVPWRIVTASKRSLPANCSSNDAIIFQFFKESGNRSFDYDHRGNGEQHSPQTHDERAGDDRDDNHQWMNVHGAAKDEGLEHDIVQDVYEHD